MAATAHRISRDEVVWAFGPDMKPVLEIDPGAIVTLETNDCFTGQIRTEADLVTEIDFDRVNSATGPIAVRGAEPGDSLVVELIEVRPDDRGFATLIPGMGQLIEQVQSPLTHVFRVDGDTIARPTEPGRRRSLPPRRFSECCRSRRRPACRCATRRRRSCTVHLSGSARGARLVAAGQQPVLARPRRARRRRGPRARLAAAR